MAGMVAQLSPWGVLMVLVMSSPQIKAQTPSDSSSETPSEAPSDIACGKWTPDGQTSQPSLFIYFASGRLAARMTPYSILLCLKLKHNLKIAIDRNTVNSLNKYFLLPSL